MKPKFACADFAFPLLEHGKVLKLISMLEFEAVDVGLFEGRSHLQPSTEFATLEKRAKRLKQELEQNGLVAADVFLQCDNDFAKYAINHPEKSRRDFARDWYLQTLDYARHLNCKHVTILPGVETDDEDYQTAFNRAVDELAWRVSKAADYQITLGVEAHIGSLVEEPEQAEKLVKSVEGLTLTLDYTHFERMGIPEERYSILMPYASHFHARNAAPGQLQTVSQENTIDYEKVVKDMIKTNYAGFVGIEFIWMEWENGNRVDNVSESILLKQFIEACWAKYEKAGA